MRLVVGVGISSDAVRAIGVEGEAVRWAVETERTAGEPLATALAALFTRCPLPRRSRASAVIAVGPAAAQVKRVPGLPSVSDPSMLAALVREGASRFFLQTDGALVTTGVRTIEPGVVWAAAIEAQVVADVQRACDTARLRLRTVVPTAVALGYAVQDEQLVWRDGGVSSCLTFASGQVESVRRLPADSSVVPTQATLVTTLAVLGDQALAFADAYGATRVPRHEALSLRVDAANRHGASRGRLVGAVTVLLVMSTAALVAPGLAALYVAHRAGARLAVLAERARQASDTEHELGRVTGSLREMAAFESSRHGVTVLLRQVTAALPEKSALAAFQLDTAGGTLVALTPRAAGVIDALEHVAGISTPAIVGPVTRETVPTAGELERVTVHFRLWRGASVPTSRAGTGGHP